MKMTTANQGCGVGTVSSNGERACLPDRQSIRLKGWGMDAAGGNTAGRPNDPPVQRAIAEGMLLVVSPFDDAIAAPSAR